MRSLQLKSVIPTCGRAKLRTLHLPLLVHNHPRVVLKVDDHTVLSADGLALSDDDAWHDLLAKLWFTLLYGPDEHIPESSGREPIQAALDACAQRVVRPKR